MATGLIAGAGAVGTLSAIFFLNSLSQNAGVAVQGLTKIAIPEKLPKVDQNINPDEPNLPELSEKNKVSFIKRQEIRIDAIQKSLTFWLSSTYLTEPEKFKKHLYDPALPAIAAEMSSSKWVIKSPHR